ncbi:MAG: nuclear transport factor 2 family protein [Bacteroidales bacterium]|nr:nuclear transport factor 2 family protein [Bacteroidales bacterium]
MKKIALSIIAALMVLTLQAQDHNNKADSLAISQVIKDAYIDGIFNKGDAEAVARGWHWDCDINIFLERRDQVMKNPSFVFVKMFENGSKAFHPGTTFKMPFIHITGYAAIAIVEVFQENKQIYTDYMNFYKFKKDGWQIVTKTYFDHSSQE